MQEPLRKIETFAAMIVKSEYATLSEKGRDYFRRMQGASARMKTLLEDLLTYSKTKMAVQEFEKTDLNIVVAEVVAELEENIAEKAAIMEVGELGEVWINHSQFRQVLHNLIGNALKFSKAVSEPRITITSSRGDGEALQAGNPSLPTGCLSAGAVYRHVIFADNGIGFDPQYNEKIFEIFQRLHSNAEFAGTGIGLAIVKKIIEHHGGAIMASGEAGSGATFHIYLPAT